MKVTQPKFELGLLISIYAPLTVTVAIHFIYSYKQFNTHLMPHANGLAPY